MRYLVDTNVLLRFSDEGYKFSQVLRSKVDFLRSQKHQLVTTSQNLSEFWNVATRPVERNGFGLNISELLPFFEEIESLFLRLEDSSQIYLEWRRLVLTYEVKGVQVHDARLVAAMKVHGIRNILTLNGKDFRRYEPEGLVIVDPLSIGNRENK